MAANQTHNSRSILNDSQTLHMHPSDLISQLLHEQSTLTAVEEFSTWHKTHPEPEQAQYYRNLMPATMPQPGQQLAFEVDLDKCSGCKACVVACHSLNGLDEGESFRDVGLLLAPAEGLALFQHVTTACHHCVDPGCLSACPVNAYEKDPVTGIVRHLDDQCFGCQYCTMACPYEVPKYHAAKGIVRKCDMCTQRLSAGEAPACVQACPHQAISIRTIDIAAARADASAGTFLPDSPDPRITVPTTRYVGRATTNPTMRAGTYSAHPLEHAHLPLILLLVLSQIAVGIVVLVFVLNNTVGWDQPLTGRAGISLRTALLCLAAVLAACSAISSTLHLGRPQFAYRAILGIRHSWLSREIAAFGTCIPLCFLSAGLSWLDSAWLNLSLIAAAMSGLAGVMASAMIYHVTHRPFWNVARSLPAFLSASLGIGSMIVLWGLQFSAPGAGPAICRMLACAPAGSAETKLALHRYLLRPRGIGSAIAPNATLQHESVSRDVHAVGADVQHASLVETSLLLSTRLRFELRLQAVGQIIFLVMSVIVNIWPVGAHVSLFTGLAVIAAVVAEITERFLFFRAVVPLRMPGVMKS
ncbi:MAG: DmsC/YnfH family molybdoenzyme membrane anchor subunit [Planctomycetaceae bacterium]